MNQPLYLCVSASASEPFPYWASENSWDGLSKAVLPAGLSRGLLANSSSLWEYADSLSKPCSLILKEFAAFPLAYKSDADCGFGGPETFFASRVRSLAKPEN